MASRPCLPTMSCMTRRRSSTSRPRRRFRRCGPREISLPRAGNETLRSAQLSEETLTPAQLKRELQRIACGQVRLAQKLGVSPTEVRNWLAGEEPVPDVVASDIRHLPSHTTRPPRPSQVH